MNTYGSGLTEFKSLSLEMTSSDKAKMTFSGDVSIKSGTSRTVSFGCDDLDNVTTSSNGKFCYLLLGNTSNGITSSCATDSGMVLYSVGSTSIGMMNPATGLITNLFSIGNTNTSYNSLSMYNNNITDVAAPTSANDAATKTYVDTMIPVFKTVTGVLGNANQDNTILPFTTSKTPQNGKIYLGKMWVESGVGEWFSIETNYVASVFNNTFQFGYKASTTKVTVYFSTKPASGWTLN